MTKNNDVAGFCCYHQYHYSCSVYMIKNVGVSENLNVFKTNVMPMKSFCTWRGQWTSNEMLINTCDDDQWSGYGLTDKDIYITLTVWDKLHWRQFINEIWAIPWPFFTFVLPYFISTKGKQCFSLFYQHVLHILENP
jgi:hypothetical protein